MGARDGRDVLFWLWGQDISAVTLSHREDLDQTFDVPASGRFTPDCILGRGGARGFLGAVLVALGGLRTAGLCGARREDEEWVAFTVCLGAGWVATFLGGWDRTRSRSRRVPGCLTAPCYKGSDLRNRPARGQTAIVDAYLLDRKGGGEFLATRSAVRGSGFLGFGWRHSKSVAGN